MRISLLVRNRVRALLALVAITLNLFGSGVPLLHAAAHADSEHSHHSAHPDEHEEASAAHGDDHHEHGSSVVPTAEPYEPDHAAALHDECIYLGKLTGVYLLPPLPRLIFAAPGVARVVKFDHTSVQLRSRAPPPGDPARAPPQV